MPKIRICKPARFRGSSGTLELKPRGSYEFMFSRRLERLRLLTFVFCSLPLSVVWAQKAPNTNLSGTWSLQSDSAIKWILTQTADSMQLKEMKGTEVQADLSCNIGGKECDGKDEGHTVKVSMWFNGPKLVVLETRGDNITRSRLEVGAKGQTLKVEVTHMSSGTKSEKLTFLRENSPNGTP